MEEHAGMGRRVTSEAGRGWAVRRSQGKTEESRSTLMKRHGDPVRQEGGECQRPGPTGEESCPGDEKT